MLRALRPQVVPVFLYDQINCFSLVNELHSVKILNFCNKCITIILYICYKTPVAIITYCNFDIVFCSIILCYIQVAGIDLLNLIVIRLRISITKICK